MTKTKSTKRALLTSALALLMCVSMLIGSTFAWFTDSVTSTGNKIVAGSLNIDMSVMDENGTYQSVKENSDAIFGYTLWEPGYTEWKNIKVSTAGNLALKYAMNIVIKGERSILADVIDVYYAASEIKKPADRSLDGLTRLGTISEVLDGTTGALIRDTLIPDQNNTEDYATIALKMQESAGNDYQGKTIGEFDIQILATQYTYEEDSFDDQYDANIESSTDGVTQTLDDGSIVFYYNEDSGYNGRVRLIGLPENVGNEYVVPAVVNDLGSALKGADLDKLTLPAGLENAYKSLQGVTVDEVVIADGATVIPNRTFYQANVKNVVIPETVTTIEENAFAMAAPETLTIPASVTRIGEAAFQHMPNLKTVTFKGSPAVEGYAFRGCAELRTVNIEGDDITFVVSATGKNSCWFCNGESNNPNTSNITFYVENETVAARVRAALDAEKPETTPIYVKEKLFVAVKSAAEFQTALDNAVNNTVITLTADITGDVTFTQMNNVSLVLDGNGKKMNGSINITARADIGNAATLEIKNFNFETTDATRYFIKSSETNRYPNNLTISNCTFEGTGADSTVVAVNVKTANNFVIKDCKANNVHSLLMNDRGGWNYTIQNCEVTNAGRGLNLNSVQGALVEEVKIQASDNKYGIRIDAEYNNSVTIKDCEISAFCPVVVRKASANYALVFEGENTMTAANTDGIWCAIGTSEYEANGALPTAATGRVTVTLNDTGLDAAGVYGQATN